MHFELYVVLHVLKLRRTTDCEFYERRCRLAVFRSTWYQFLRVCTSRREMRCSPFYSLPDKKTRGGGLVAPGNASGLVRGLLRGFSILKENEPNKSETVKSVGPAGISMASRSQSEQFPFLFVKTVGNDHRSPVRFPRHCTVRDHRLRASQSVHLVSRDTHANLNISRGVLTSSTKTRTQHTEESKISQRIYDVVHYTPM